MPPKSRLPLSEYPPCKYKETCGCYDAKYKICEEQAGDCNLFWHFMRRQVESELNLILNPIAEGKHER